jgi:hypothetical protein
MLATAAGYQGPLPELMALTNRCIQDLIVIIPEPATLATLGAGTVLLVVRRRLGRT